MLSYLSNISYSYIKVVLHYKFLRNDDDTGLNRFPAHPDPDRVNEIIPNSGQEGCCVEILYTLVPKVGQADLHGSKHKNNIWLTTIPFFYFPSLNSSSLFPEFYFHYLPGINDHQNLDHHHKWSWSSSSWLPSSPTWIVTKIHLFNTSPLHPHKFQWLVRVSKLLDLG